MLLIVGLNGDVAGQIGMRLGWLPPSLSTAAHAASWRPSPSVVVYRGALAARTVAMLRAVHGCEVLVVVDAALPQERRAVMAAGAAGYLIEGETPLLLDAIEALVSVAASSGRRRRAFPH